jgi:hypothetical protein
MTSSPDGNIAFKVTWVYGTNGPFSSPCNPRGRKINVVENPRVWCSQQDCPCAEIYHQHGNAGDYWQYHNRKNFDEWPCYDAMAFSRWQFGTGIYHQGANMGNPIPIKHWKQGKLAFLTSREPDKPEAERRIIGCFSVDRMTPHREWGNVFHAGSVRLRAANFHQAPFYWKFHSQAVGPRWNTGLFRYIPYKEARAMLKALKGVSSVSQSGPVIGSTSEGGF